MTSDNNAAVATADNATKNQASVKKLPYRLFVGPVTQNNVNQLRLLNNTLFPVRYDRKVYDQCVVDGESICQLGYFNDICVGSICARAEESGDMYIMMLGVLAPYKRRGLGKKMLEKVMESCNPGQRVFLHVSTKNTDAREFYENYGFQVKETVAEYYKRNVLNDGGDGSAWLLEFTNAQ